MKVLIRGLCLFVFWFGIFSHSESAADPKISFINVGQGNCTILDCGNNHKLVVDCGSSSRVGLNRKDFTGNPAHNMKYTKPEDIRDYINAYYMPPQDKQIVVLISHPDDDHLNLLQSILRELNNSKKVTVLLGGPLELYFETINNANLIQYFLDKKVQLISLSHDLDEDSLLEVIGKLKAAYEAAHKVSEDVTGSPDEKKLKRLAITAALKIQLKKIIREKSEYFRGHLLSVDPKSFLNGGAAYNATSPGKVKGTNFCPNFDLEILSANAGQTPLSYSTVTGKSFVSSLDSGANLNSVVLLITRHGKNQRVILTGDAEGRTTEQIARYYSHKTAAAGRRPENFEPVDLLLACHHGAETHGSNNEEWINLTKPKSVIFSSGLNKTYLHPRCSTVRNYGMRIGGSVPHHSLTCGEKSRSIAAVLPGFSREDTVFKDSSSHNVSYANYFNTTSMSRPLYTTHDSGTITAYFKDDKISVTAEKKGIPPYHLPALVQEGLYEVRTAPGTSRSFEKYPDLRPSRQKELLNKNTELRQNIQIINNEKEGLIIQLDDFRGRLGLGTSHADPSQRRARRAFGLTSRHSIPMTSSPPHRQVGRGGGGSSPADPSQGRARGVSGATSRHPSLIAGMPFYSKVGRGGEGSSPADPSQGRARGVSGATSRHPSLILIREQNR